MASMKSPKVRSREAVARDLPLHSWDLSGWSGQKQTEHPMSDNPKTSERDPARPPNREKDPDDWTTGDEPMTGAQASYLKTLCEEAGEEFDPNLSKAEASKRIDALRAKTGRGR
jgi:hypothetical protein